MPTNHVIAPVLNGMFPVSKSPRVDRDVFMKLSSGMLAHVLGFLEIQDKLHFLSTNTTNAKEPLTFAMKTYCGTCQACLDKTEYLCTRSRERLWTSKAWTSIFRRFGLGMQELHLAGCNGIVPSVFTSTQAKRMLASISVLRVDHCSNFPMEAIAEIAKYCCNLRELRLHDLAVNDAMVSAIITSNASTLKVVDLKGCHAVKGSFLSGISEQSVEDINLQGCHSLDIPTFEAAAPSMKNIKRLNLRFCHKVTDKTIDCIVQHMPKLQDLNLRYCYKLTDAGVAALCEHAPKLKSLNLSQCWRLTDKAIWQLTKLSFLKELRLWGCMNLTSSSVVACLALPSLTLVDIRSRDKLEAVIGGFSTVKHVMESHRSTLLKWEQSADKVGVFHRKATHTLVVQKC